MLSYTYSTGDTLIVVHTRKQKTHKKQNHVEFRGEKESHILMEQTTTHIKIK